MKKIHSYSLQGRREYNEDTHFHIENLDGKIKEINDINFIGLFDGHGGKKISSYLKENLPLYFLKKYHKNIYTKPSTATKIFNKFFDIVQNNLIAEHPQVIKRCGSTACIGIHHKHKNQHKLWVLNVGDTRMVKCNKMNIAEQLSLDHKPNEPSEKLRITQLGGEVKKAPNDDYRIGNLAVSRAFGDLDCVPYVTHNPSIYYYNINQGDKFIILGCDGVWDVLSNQDAVDYVNSLLLNGSYRGNIAKDLAEYAYCNHSSDNITIIVYLLE
jgi:serine/threonine protein phosphatase PrpC